MPTEFQTDARAEMNSRLTARRRLITWAFYGGLTLVLVLILTTLLPRVLPGGWASRISYNSEAYHFAVVLVAWIQFGLPRIPERTRLNWALAFGAFWALVGIGLIMSDLPSRVRTLNESAFALAILIPYVTLRRPLPRWILLTVPIMIALTVWAVGWAPESWVIDQAETFGFVILAVLTFDLIDRGLLEPGQRATKAALWSWYGFMVLEPVIVSALGTGARQGEGVMPLTLEYLGRVHESFVGVLLVVMMIYVIRPAHVRPAAP